MNGVTYRVIDLNQGLGLCGHCGDELNREKMVVAHSDGGEQHPIHLDCLKDTVTDAILDSKQSRCPDCLLPSDIDTIVPQRERRIIRLGNFIILTAAQVSVFAASKIASYVLSHTNSTLTFSGFAIAAMGLSGPVHANARGIKQIIQAAMISGAFTGAFLALGNTLLELLSITNGSLVNVRILSRTTVVDAVLLGSVVGSMGAVGGMVSGFLTGMVGIELMKGIKATAEKINPEYGRAFEIPSLLKFSFGCSIICMGAVGADATMILLSRIIDKYITLKLLL